MNDNLGEYNPEHTKGPYVWDLMALSKFCEVTSMPELMSWISFIFQLQDVIKVWMMWRQLRFPPEVRPKPSSNASVTLVDITVPMMYKTANDAAQAPEVASCMSVNDYSSGSFDVKRQNEKYKKRTKKWVP
jgi:hypothetical protein